MKKYEAPTMDITSYEVSESLSVSTAEANNTNGIRIGGIDDIWSLG